MLPFHKPPLVPGKEQRRGSIINISIIVLFFLLGASPGSEFYVPMFRNTLFHLHRWCNEDVTDSVPKRRQITPGKFTQKKEYNTENTAKVLIQ
jgi:hypothetical protein